MVRRRIFKIGPTFNCLARFGMMKEDRRTPTEKSQSHCHEEPFFSFYLPVRRREIRIRHREVHNPLNQRSNERNQGPTEQQVEDAHSNFAKVEFMTANASEEQSEQCRRQAIAARR